MSVTHTYKAAARTVTGTRNARRLRASGSVPVTVSRRGKDSSLLQVDEKTANQFDAQVVHLAKLEIDGKPITVLRGAVDKDPLTDRIRHIDVLEVDEKATIKVDIAVLVDARHCVGVKAGGLVEQRLRKVKVECPANAIPDSVTVDITDVELMQTVLVDRVKLPAGVKLVTPAKNPLLSVVIPRGMAKTETAATPAEGEAAAAPAAAGDKAAAPAAPAAGDKAAAPAKKK